MKKILLLLFVALPILGIAQQEHMTFKGVPIDGKLTDMVAKLEKVGFGNRSNFDNCHYVLSGTFTGENCDILITGTPKTKTACSVLVSYEETYTSWSAVKNKYQELKKAFTIKYGEPTRSNDTFEYPYIEGDGGEMTAIAVNKCKYNCLFQNEGKGNIFMHITKANGGAQIIIMYSDEINSKLKEKEENDNILNDI